MRLRVYTSGSILTLTTFVLFLVFVHSTIAQTVTNPSISTTTTAGAERVPATGTSPSSPSPKLKALKSATRDRAKLAAYNNAAWYALLHQGSCTNPQSTACANDALVLAGSTCSSSALIFQKGTAVWQKWQFALVMASAGFTGVGSAATLAGSTVVPKVFSTLGGTTGLGAVTATTNSNISDNQAGVSAVNSIQSEIQKLPPPVNGDSATNQSILSQANGYANQCVAANPVGTTGGSKPAGSGTVTTAPILTSATLAPKVRGTALAKGVAATLTVQGSNLVANDTQVVGFGVTITLSTVTATTSTVDLTLPATYAAGMQVHLASTGNPSLTSATVSTTEAP